MSLFLHNGKLINNEGGLYLHGGMLGGAAPAPQGARVIDLTIGGVTATGVINQPVPTPVVMDLPLTESLIMNKGTGLATFSRATPKYYTDKDTGLLTLAAIDEPCFETDGYFVEGPSVNRVMYSHDLTNAAYIKRAGMAVVSDATLWADGLTGCQKISNDGSQVAGAGIYQEKIEGTNATQAVSCYVRAGDISSAQILLKNAATDEVKGVATITNLSSEWQRISVTGTTDAVVNKGWRVELTTNGETGFIYAKGLQVETLDGVSSLIETGATAYQIRERDILSIDPGNLPAAGDDFSYQLTYKASVIKAQDYAILLMSVPTDRRCRIVWSGHTTDVKARGKSSKGNTAWINGDSRTIFVSLDQATGDQNLWEDGILQDTDTATTPGVTVFTSYEIGGTGDGNAVFGHIKNFITYNEVLMPGEV